MEAAASTCYRHPSYETYVSCVRCERFICPSCMREAAVGHQCVECVKEGQRSVRRARTVFGGTVARSAVPVVTYALIALNVLAYVVELIRPGVVDRFAMTGAGLTDAGGGRYLYVDGGIPGLDVVGVVDGEWYRLLTGSFLHLPPEGTSFGALPFGVLHIVFNMYALWNLGRVVEEQLGRVRFLALYLLAALGGSVLVYLVSPSDQVVGASGAVFGLAAAFYVISRRLGRDMQAVNSFLAGFLVWMLVSAAFTSWEAHLGGLLTGAAVTVVYAYAPAGRRTAVQTAGCVVLAAVLILLVVLKTSALTG
ncbi:MULTISPECIES: rhomboid family intramembrane serine protease [unclassified Streptomyces]|uniref:rhomboid family intramembrane serine protease n=1 Tax=unclassified Streptomyces TaxID=2593676 RepID=UPI002ECFB2FF|nr:rhomboid family intramembrane serine protease [Streptomyces sp. NBC_00891]WSY04944.1 rhomboid family intramembrane serine protease [Streptomyces sp. NBC_00890]WSZ06569.1 rhomboid family intramembrane serine protease [Streptomyces sp. NBC_00869]WSZ25935.1 rhomboid family intramembrane serine protease [Streptomyces sp. NBC_00870]